MKYNRIKYITSMVMSVMLMISCMSCSSGAILAGGGTGGSGIVSKGVIAAFGSIVVNGTEFDTSNALIIIDGEEIGIGDDIVLSNLDLGKYVTVIGEGDEDNNNAVAEKVIYSNNVKGPVESIISVDERTKELIVMGQNVMLNAVTKFKGTSFNDIAAHDIIEISGMFDDMGTIQATFIEKTGEFVPGMIVEVVGFIKNLDTTYQTFNINDLTVDYSQANIAGLIPDGLAEGLFVEVEGELVAVDESMQANRIELADDLEISDADQIEVMGFVTEVLSLVEFKLGNQMVNIDDDVLFVDGKAEDIVPGVKLEAEGILENGILHAWEVEFWEPDQIELEGVVSDIVSVFEFHMGSQVVYTNEETRFEDGTPNDISLGTSLEIKGKMIDGILVADKVSFELE